MTKEKHKDIKPHKVKPHERRLIEQSAHTIISLCETVQALCREGHYDPFVGAWGNWQMELVFKKAGAAQLQAEVLMNILGDTE